MIPRVKDVMKFLDWNSRLNLNLALPRQYRVSTKIPKEECIAHDFSVLVKLIQGLLGKTENTANREDRAINIINMYRRLDNPDCVFLISSKPDLRYNVIKKLIEFSSADRTGSIQGISFNTHKRLKHVCRKLHQTLLEAPPQMQYKNLKEKCIELK